jgi:purine-binding chemotaxis protein CheW
MQTVEHFQSSINLSQDKQQFLVFTLNERIYSVLISYINEIIEYTHLTPVPMVTECVRGVLNLRGHVLPVIDLSIRMGGEPIKENKRTCILIVTVNYNQESVKMGIVVDAVNDVINLAVSDLEAPPPFGNRIRSDFIQNVGRIDGGFITILNLEQVLSIKELMIS